jgi:hypothetical protein
MATRITIRGYEFSYLGSGLEPISVPLLRALAIGNCNSALGLFDRLEANRCPSLSALMITDVSYFPMNVFQRFLKKIRSLRELVLCSEITDFTVITDHAATLELLSLVRKSPHVNLELLSMPHDYIHAMFSSLTALRYLCLSSGNHLIIRTDGRMENLSGTLQITLVSWTTYLKHYIDYFLLA